MIKASVAIAILGVAMIPMAYAMNLMESVGWGTLALMVVTLVAMAIALAFVSALAGPIIIAAVAFGIFGIALVIIAAALLIASHAFERFTKCVVMLADIGLVSLGLGFIVAGAGMLIGAAAMLAAMLLGALMVVPAGIFWAASKLIKWGFQNILEGIGDINNLEVMGKSMLLALGGLAIGVEMVVGSSYFRFWRASKAIAEGLGPLMMIALLASVFDFPKATNGIAKSLKNLGDATKSFGSASGFKTSAIAFRNAVAIIGSGIWYYATYVEQAAARVIDAVATVTASAGLLKLFGLDEIVKTAATVTVKADLEDKNREAADREGQTELLQGIKNALTGISTAMAGLTGGGQTAEQLEQIRTIVGEYLPEIAEGGGGGLVDSTNQWNSNMG